MVSLCPCGVLLQLHLDAMVLNPLLRDRFVHCSRQNTATDDVLLRRVCSDRRTTLLLLLRPRSLLQRVRGELLDLPVLFI